MRSETYSSNGNHCAMSIERKYRNWMPNGISAQFTVQHAKSFRSFSLHLHHTDWLSSTLQKKKYDRKKLKAWKKKRNFLFPSFSMLPEESALKQFWFCSSQRSIHNSWCKREKKIKPTKVQNEYIKEVIIFLVRFFDLNNFSMLYLFHFVSESIIFSSRSTLVLGVRKAYYAETFDKKYLVMVSRWAFFYELSPYHSFNWIVNWSFSSFFFLPLWRMLIHWRKNSFVVWVTFFQWLFVINRVLK